MTADPISATNAVDLLEVFENPAPKRDYRIVHTVREFTSMCPITGHPDFATIHVSYIPDAVCVELKSLKLYFHSYRNVGVFYEALINRVTDDLVACMNPRRLVVRGSFRGRGGISSVIKAGYRQPESRDGSA